MSALLRVLAGGWHLEAVPILAALIAGGLYLRGCLVLGAASRPSRAQVAAFAAGLGAIVLALLSPLDDLAAQLQWAHMTQHLLLLLVAPPLLMLARPLSTALAGLPAATRSRLDGVLAGRLGTGGAPALSLLVASLFTATMWTWHLPRLYDATLANHAVHDLEHSSFLAAGLLFWAFVAGRAVWAPSLGHVGRAAVCLFGLITSLPARRLTSPDSLLCSSGFMLRHRRQFEWGLLHSDLWAARQWRVPQGTCVHPKGCLWHGRHSEAGHRRARG